MFNPKSFQTVQSLAQTYPGVSTQAKGYVEQAINPNRRGRVRYQATYWFGICADARSLPSGMEVTVIGRQGNTLIVQPIVS
jgi:membrane protein implicated in regulation of membrane protease activity